MRLGVASLSIIFLTLFISLEPLSSVSIGLLAAQLFGWFLLADAPLQLVVRVRPSWSRTTNSSHVFCSSFVVFSSLFQRTSPVPPFRLHWSCPGFSMGTGRYCTSPPSSYPVPCGVAGLPVPCLNPSPPSQSFISALFALRTAAFRATSFGSGKILRRGELRYFTNTAHRGRISHIVAVAAPFPYWLRLLLPGATTQVQFLFRHFAFVSEPSNGQRNDERRQQRLSVPALSSTEGLDPPLRW